MRMKSISRILGTPTYANYNHDTELGRNQKFRNGLEQFRRQILARITPRQLNESKFGTFQTTSEAIEFEILLGHSGIHESILDELS